MIIQPFLISLFLLLISPYSYSGEDKSICENKSSHLWWNELQSLIKNNIKNCNPHKVHLTFDDGPSAQVTPIILDELKKRNISSTFFITTTNLDKSHKNSVILQQLVQRELNENNLVASHGYEHESYDLRMHGQTIDPGFTSIEQSRQIKASEDLLNLSTQGAFAKQKYKLFRFPYGRGAMPSEMELNEMDKRGTLHFSSKEYSIRLKEYRQSSLPMVSISEQGFSHLGWNHDSHDSSIPVKMPKDDVVKKYIIDNLAAMCASKEKIQVALFHDIKEINKTAIPLLVDLSQCLGMSYISPSEMMDQSERLKKTGVFIPKIHQTETVKTLLADMKSISEKVKGPTPLCETPSVNEETPLYKSCFSQSLNKVLLHCQGQDFICFDGKWLKRSDPIITLNCNISSYE